MHTDQLQWLQLSDLKGYEGPVASLYGIGSLPRNLLLDPEGIIIAKDLRGENLLKQLESIKFFDKVQKQ